MNAILLLPSGLAVASRLSEDPHTTVAVLEVGSNAENLPEVQLTWDSIVRI